jgi:hypothetical protein
VESWQGREDAQMGGGERGEIESGRKEGDQNDWGENLNPFYPLTSLTGRITETKQEQTKIHKRETRGSSREKFNGGRMDRAERWP